MTYSIYPMIMTIFFYQDPEDSEHDIESSREWKKLISEWIEMVNGG